MNPFLFIFIILLCITLAKIIYDIRKNKDITDFYKPLVNINYNSEGVDEEVKVEVEEVNRQKEVVEVEEETEKIVETEETIETEETPITGGGGLEIIYDKKYKKGDVLNYVVAKEPPTIRYSNAQADKKYTIMMVDPDIPSYKDNSEAEWRYWVLGNIPGESLINGISDTRHGGIILTTYNGPMPKVGTSWHRYYFKIYEQPETMPWYPIGGMRNNWKSSEFAKSYKLKKIAQSYLLAKRDFDGRKLRHLDKVGNMI